MANVNDSESKSCEYNYWSVLTVLVDVLRVAMLQLRTLRLAGGTTAQSLMRHIAASTYYF